MLSALIIHGIEGSPKENWFPWLTKELEERGWNVIVPQFPSPEKPTLDDWLDHFSREKYPLDEDTTLIGHSLGAAFALRLLERTPSSVAATYLVAPVWTVMGNAFDHRMTSFEEPPMNWQNIRKHCPRFTVIGSDDDPYIRLDLTKELAHHLGTEATIVPGAKHFNAGAGYTSFPLLKERLLMSYR